MTSRVDDFKAAFRSGFARSNRYRVFFEDTEQGARNLNIMCDSVAIPGRDIFTTERITSTKQKKVVYGFGQEDISISFILNNDWTAWNFIYDWEKSIVLNIDQLDGFKVAFKESYSRDILIEHLNTNDEVMKTFRIMNSYPTQLSSLELSNGSENEIIRVNASFAFDNWKLEGE